MKRTSPILKTFALLMAILLAGGPAAAQDGVNSSSVSASSSNAQSISVSPGWKAQWRFLMGAEDDQTVETSRRFVVTRIDFGFKYLLDDSLVFKMTPSVHMQSGASQTWDGTSVQQNQIYFSEASIMWKPAAWFLLKGGALDQSETHSPLLIGQRPFPGALTGFALGDSSSVRYGIFAETAVPTSVSLTTNQGQKEQIPGLETLQARLEWKNGPLWNATVRIGSFIYSNLPSGTSNDSAILGNTVLRLADSESAFIYQYQGYEALASLHFPLGRWDGDITASGLENTAAPAGKNSAWLTKGRMRIPWNSKLDLIAGGEAYHIESDAAVASFVDDSFMGTNRNGYAAEAGVAFGKHKIRLIGHLGESDVIVQNDPQSRDQYFVLKLESDYADF